MQTNPLSVSQLAQHTKLPVMKTVQDHTQELLRHRTTLPPLNSTSATQLRVRVKELPVWALSLRRDSSLRGQRSPRRGRDRGCGGWGSNGDGHLAQPGPRCLLEARVPSGASGTEVTCLHQLCWKNWLHLLWEAALSAVRPLQESELLPAEPQSKSHLTELCTKHWHK